MEVDATSKDVWTWETFEGELCSVSSSTDGTNLGFHSCFLDGLFGNVDDIHHWFYLLTHVVVLVLQFELCHVAIFLIDFGYGFLHALLALLKNLAVVVTDDVGNGCFLTVATDTREVEKAFVTFSVLRCFHFGKQRNEFCCYTSRINHLVFGITWVDAATRDAHFCRGCVEVLEFDFTYFGTIHSVGKFTTEFFNIELMGTHANFLIRIKTYTNLAVLNFRMFHEINTSGDDFSNTSLIVGTEKGVSVCNDDVLTYVVEQFWKLAWGTDDTFGKDDVATIVILHNARLHVGS